MKPFLFSLILAIRLLAMGEDTVEALYLCKSPDAVRLVTIIHQIDNPLDRAIFINIWDALLDETQQQFIPIQVPASFRSSKPLAAWLTPIYGRTSCTRITAEQAQAQFDLQTRSIDAISNLR